MKSVTVQNLLDTLVNFAHDLQFENIPVEVIREAKRRLFDSYGCAFFGWRDPAIEVTFEISSFFADHDLPFWGYFTTHLIRVLDWNDTYLSMEPAHPSDNIGALFAVVDFLRVKEEKRRISGKEFLTALVLAYEIQCRFCDAASLRKQGWDHVIYVTIASTLASAKLLGLSKPQMRQAVALALNSGITMRQVRVGQVSMQKGASAAEAVRTALFAVLRAQYGMSGPSEIFEGPHGFIRQVAKRFKLATFKDLGKDFKLPQTYIKVYPVEYHAQAVVEAALALREEIVDPNDIERIDIFSYEAARTIIGDPAKRRPETKESADHSLFYILAVTLLDGQMSFAQFESSRFHDPQVLTLIDTMSDVQETDEFNSAYKRQEFPVRIDIHMKGGEIFSSTVQNPLGHPKRPLTDEQLKEKFSSVSTEGRIPFPADAIWEDVQEIEREDDVGAKTAAAEILLLGGGNRHEDVN